MTQWNDSTKLKENSSKSDSELKLMLGQRQKADILARRLQDDPVNYGSNMNGKEERKE
jgi:hypothetical protein